MQALRKHLGYFCACLKDTFIKKNTHKHVHFGVTFVCLNPKTILGLVVMFIFFTPNTIKMLIITLSKKGACKSRIMCHCKVPSYFTLKMNEKESADCLLSSNQVFRLSVHFVPSHWPQYQTMFLLEDIAFLGS